MAKRGDFSGEGGGAARAPAAQNVLTRRTALGAAVGLAAVPMHAQGFAAGSGPQGSGIGGPGLSEPIRVAGGAAVASLAQLKGAATVSDTLLWAGVPFHWETEHAPYASDEGQPFVTTVESDHQPLRTGAWVRQDAASIQFRHGGRAVPRTVENVLRDLPVSPEDFAAAGDGVTNDTAALQAAFDSGRSVHLSTGKTYLVKSMLTLSADNVSLSGGGRIKIARDFAIGADADANGTHLRALLVTGNRATITGVTFDATDARPGSAAENGFIWSTAPYTSVRDCRFIANPKGTCIWSLSTAPYLSVIGCQFENCSGAVFAKGRNPVIANNIIINATDAAIAINGLSCVGATITGNTISNEKNALIPSMIAVEEGASNWVISGNSLTGVTGGGIFATNVLDNTMADGGTITGNIVDGKSFDRKMKRSANPAALVFVSNSYAKCIISNNRITNCPTGNANSRLVIIPATGTLFSDNIVDGSATPELSAMIEIILGQGGITIQDNITEGASGSRHFLFGAGDYGNAPCSFIGGRFLTGTEGINCEQNAAGMRNFMLEIRDVSHSTIRPSLVSAATAIGDRAKFLNAGAWLRPHRIGTCTEMHCDALPADAGRSPFQNGDKFYYLSPAPGGPVGVVRTGAGFVGFGRLDRG